jgi:hypothetical protein
MSSDVTLLLHTDRHAVAAVFRQLFARLQPRLSNYCGEHAIKRHDHAQKIVATALPAQLPALMTDIVDSNRWVSISMDYTLASGALLDLSIHCNGQHYEHEWWVRLYGYLWIEFELKYIVPPQEGGVQRPPVATHPAFPGQRFTDTEELFFRIVGLTTTSLSVSLVHHAWLEHNNFVVSPLKCALAYHQKATDFVRDLAFGYVHYNREMLLPEQLVLTNGSWVVGQSPLDCPPSRRPMKDGNDVIEETLLTKLDDDRVRRLVTLPDAVALPLIHQAVQDTAGVRWYDFGDRGTVVSTGDPQVWLWPFYQALLERVVQHLG